MTNGIVFMLKMLSEFVVMERDCNLLFERKMLKYFLFTEIFHIPYILIFGIVGIFVNFGWKERKLSR